MESQVQPFYGYLKKKGQGSSLLGRRSWKKRFFVLDGPYLMWYENEYVFANGLPPLGAVILCPDSTKCTVQVSSSSTPKQAPSTQEIDSTSKSKLQNSSSSTSSYSSSSSFSSEEGSKDENQRDDTSTNSATKKKSRKYGFEVVTVARTLYMQASTEEERQQWMERLDLHRFHTPKPLPFL